MSKGGSVVDELAWCHDAVVDVSRTFAITIERLAPPMADRICVGYLMCRVADTIEDAGHIPPDDQVHLLEHYESVLENEASLDTFENEVAEWVPPAEDRSDDWDVVANVDRVHRAFDSLPQASRDAIRGPASELVSGMAMFVDRYADAGGLRIRTIDELEEYCWYAAGTVGELVTNLLAEDATPERRRSMREHAEAFALLLQLVNVAKDVGDDYREENNVYLPIEWLREAGIGPDDLANPEAAGAVGSVVERLVDRAAGYLDGAQAYLMAMPETQGNTLSAWAIPKLLAVGTIRELRAHPEAVVDGDVKVSRSEVYALIERFEAGADKEELPDLRNTMEHTPLHQA